jgi:hypothetical protein
MKNDPNIPERILREGSKDIRPMQVRRAAWLIHRIIDFKQRMDR